MKKHLLFLAVAALSFSVNTAKAQTDTIVGKSADDMEIWNPTFGNPSSSDPNNGSSGTAGWQCLNVLAGPFTGSSPVSVFEENTIIHSGSHSAKIVSVVLKSGSYTYVKGLVPDTVGVILAGTLVTSPSPGFKPGVPFKKRATAVTFWYQYYPATASKPDTGFCLVELTHYHGGTNTLGAGELRLLSTGATWTQGTVPITYDSLTGNPDTIDVVFSASNPTSKNIPVPGSILYIDGVSTNVPLGINELNSTAANVTVYPNPASSEVNFRISANGDAGYSISVYDITGKKLDNYPVRNNMATLNTSAYSAGLYFYQLYDKNGAQMKVGKFSVVK